jgi:hypothetical protein
MQDPSMEQSASGLNTTRGIDTDLTINRKEKETLRELAMKIAEISSHPREKEKADAWKDLNMLQPKCPMVFCDPENGWKEIITQEQIKCGSPIARVWEMYLRKEIFWSEKMKDDKVIEPFFNIPYHYSDSGYGIKEEDKVKGGGDGSFKYLSHLKDYEKDFEKLRFPVISIDYDKTNKVKELAEDIFGDFLTVRIKGVWWWTLGMTWDFIKIRGLENLMTDVLIQPEWVHRLMGFLRDSTLDKLAFLEKNNLLSLNNDGTYVGSGGFGWTEELPSPGYKPGKTRLNDLWGFAESQETVGIDPSLFNEFILPYQLPILEKFGLNCYGCCEPLDVRWQYVKTIPRLRRVSVSPWADVQTMSDYLGKEYIFSRKPSPTDLAVPNPDWNKIRKELREFFKNTRNNNVEIIMKDNHTLGKNPDNAITWCRIAREESMK